MLVEHALEIVFAAIDCYCTTLAEFEIVSVCAFDDITTSFALDLVADDLTHESFVPCGPVSGSGTVVSYTRLVVGVQGSGSGIHRNEQLQQSSSTRL